MKKYIRYILSIMLGVAIFARLNSVLEANFDGNMRMKGLYRLDRDTADVVFYGNSHIYGGVNTASLWDEYGISGYNLSGAIQPLWNSYYNMEETLKYQSPKVMVVDVYGALNDEEYSPSANVIKNVSSMRLSSNKIRNLWNSVPHEEFISYLLFYPLMHDSYREITKANYDREYDMIGGKWYKGFSTSFAVTNYEKLPEVDEILEKRAPSEKNRKYLDKMVSLAKKNHIDLVFLVVPYEGWQTEDEEVYVWVEEYAAENNVLFFNGNRYLEEMSFDPAIDYAESSHLNYYGASKFTKYFGSWLKSNCELKDHHGEELYDSWQKYSDCWAAYLRNAELGRITDLDEYISYLKSNENYVAFVSVSYKYKDNVYVNKLKELAEVDPYDFEYNGTFVIEGGKLLYKTPNEPEYLWYMETDSLDIAVVREYGDEMKLLINDVVQNNTYNDVTIVVYDKILDEIADSIVFNRDGIIIK